MPEVISQPGTNAEQDSAEKQSVNRRLPGFEPTEDEKTVVADWIKKVERAEERKARKDWTNDLARLRRYERGNQTVDEKKSRTNMVYATIAGQMPELYAKNPAIGVTPTDAVPQVMLGKVKKFGATAEKVIRRMLVEEGKLKKRAKANIRSTLVTGFGALKLTYQERYDADPVILHRINDTQDNLARVESLIRQIKKTDDPTELAKKRDELSANLKALTSSNEVKIFKGFAIDRIRSEDMLVLDDAIVEFDEYLEAGALGHKIWMTVADYRAKFSMEPTGATRYGRPRENDQKTDDTAADEQFVCVIEAWDKQNGVVRTYAMGMNRWAREPYAPKVVPQRWYPFYLLGFNLTEGEWRPLSDVEMLASLQEEYDRTRQNYADVREKAVPVLIFRTAGSLTEPDVEKITNRRNKDTIGVEGNPSTPLAQEFFYLQAPTIDPAAYDVSLIRNDMDIVSGRTDASRANLIKPKTATEAEIMAEAMQSRTGERRDTHEDLLTEMGEAAFEITLQRLTKAEVEQLAGEDAEWPETPQGAEEVFRMVSVKVRAGSSGKPNMQREREQWGTLLPVIKETMQAVAELRAQGNFDMADASITLLRETLRRYDETLDLDAIIPPVQRDDDGKPIAAAQAAMEAVQLRQQLAEMQQQMAQMQEELAKAKSGEQVKIREAELRADEESRAAIAEAERTAREQEADQARQVIEAQRAHELQVAQEATKQEQARLDDERAQRELAAKVASERTQALIKAAAQIVSTEISAAASARTADEGAQKDAEKRDLSEQRFTEITGRIEQTVASLAKTMQAMEKGAAERTDLVRQHLTSE